MGQRTRLARRVKNRRQLGRPWSRLSSAVPGNLPGIWGRISRPPGLVRGLKRAVFDHELNTLVAWRRREHPVVNAQQFCGGRDAIVTAASVDGKTLALVCLEVIQTSAVRGPAAVVRIIDHPQMAETARRNSFAGLD